MVSALKKKLGFDYKPEKNPGAKPEKKQGGCYPIFFPCSDPKSQVAPSNVLCRVQIKRQSVDGNKFDNMLGL